MRQRKRSEYRAHLPKVLRTPGGTVPVRGQKIPHRQILLAMEKCADLPINLTALYREKVLPQQTRTIHLLGKKSAATIIHTLLGYEVQAGYKRIQCPDMVTARYIRLFSEVGCRSIKVPYDPTVTAALIPELETAVENIRRGVVGIFPGNPKLQNYVTRRIYEIVRRQLRFP
jgi:hypothetical protein